MFILQNISELRAPNSDFRNSVGDVAEDLQLRSAPSEHEKAAPVDP